MPYFVILVNVYIKLTVAFKALNKTQYKYIFNFYLFVLTSNGYGPDDCAAYKFIYKNKD